MTLHKTLTAAIALVSATLVGAASAEEAKSLPMIHGEVTMVDGAAGKVTLKHEAITNLDMEAMTMAFKAKDPASLNSVKPGDQVMFTADKVNGQIVVMTLEKMK